MQTYQWSVKNRNCPTWQLAIISAFNCAASMVEIFMIQTWAGHRFLLIKCVCLEVTVKVSWNTISKLCTLPSHLVHVQLLEDGWMNDKEMEGCILTISPFQRKPNEIKMSLIPHEKTLNQLTMSFASYETCRHTCSGPVKKSISQPWASEMPLALSCHGTKVDKEHPQRAHDSVVHSCQDTHTHSVPLPLSHHAVTIPTNSSMQLLMQQN